MHKLKLASVVGLPQETGWAKTFASANQSLHGSLAVKGSSAKNVGFELLEMLQQPVIDSPAKLHNLLLDVLKKARDREVVIQLVVAYFTSPSLLNPEEANQDSDQHSQPTVVLATYQGQVLLRRNQKLAGLLKSDSELKMIEGALKPGDRYLLATAHNEQLEQSLRQLFKANLSPDAFASNFLQKVKMLVDSSLIAVALLELKALNIIEAQEPIETSSAKPEAELETEPVIFPINTTHEKQSVSVEQEAESAGDEKEVGTVVDAIAKEEFPQPEPKNEVLTDEPVISETELATATQVQPPVVADTAGEPNDDEQPGDIKIKISTEPVKKLAQAAGSKTLGLIKQTVATAKSKIAVWREKTAQRRQEKKQLAKKIELEPTDQTLNQAFADDNAVKSSVASTQASTSTILTRVVNILALLVAKVKFLKKLSVFRQREVYLNESSSKLRKKKLLMMVGLIVGLLLISWWVIATISQYRQQARTALAPARELLITAQQLSDQEILQARDLTAEAIELAQAEQHRQEQAQLTQDIYRDFLREAQEHYSSIAGQLEVSQLEIFLDLSEVVPNFLTSQVAINQQTLFFLDREQRQLISLELASNQTDQMLFPENFLIKDLTVGENELYLLNEGIYQVKLDDLEGEEEKPSRLPDSPIKIKDEGDSDRDSTLISFYENFLYVFNPPRRNIYRYIWRNDSLSEPIGWLTNKQGIDFSSITSMAVDGFIWLTTDGGKIVKLERGQPITFEILGLEDHLGKSIKLFTSANSEQLYVLEPEKNRVIVLSKDGKFIKQVTSPTLAGTTWLVVDETSNRAFVTSGAIVYVVEL